MPKRHVLVVATFLLSLLLYVDRVCISTAKQPIIDDLGLTDTEFGWILSAFAFGYALAQTPSGALADRLGPRLVLSSVVTAWSIFTGLTAAAWNFVSMLVVRILFGIGEAGAFPGMARAVYSWIPIQERGLVKGINFSASRIGAAVTMPLLPLMIEALGWRQSFFVLMLVGFAWAFVWWYWFRDEPDQHPTISTAERNYILANRQGAGVAQQAVEVLPVAAILSSRNMWLLMSQYFASNFTAFFCLSWLFPYIQQTFNLAYTEAGFYAMLPLLGGAVSAIWRDGEEAVPLDGYLVSANYFDALGVQPVLGRPFREEEDRTLGACPVVVIGHDFWQRSLDADPQVIGRALTLNGSAFTVIGVAPPRFHGLRILDWADFWTPTAMQPVIRPGAEHLTRGHRWMQAVGRLASGRTAESAAAELALIHAQLAQQFPGTLDGRSLQAQPLTGLPGDRQTTVRVFALLMGVVGLVLLIACANIANLFLERAAARRREIAVRLAIGGSRGRIAAPLLAEAGVVAVVGGTLGLLLGLWATDAFRMVEASVGRVGLDFSLDLRVLGFTAAASMLTVLTFGLAPAAQALNVPIVSALGARGGGDGGPLRLGLRKSLVVAQVGVCLVLLVAAGLFARSLSRIAGLDPGFRTEDLLLASFDLEKHGYNDDQGRQFVRRTLEELRSIAGISSATVTHSPPFGFEQSATLLQPSSAAADVPEAERRNRYRVEYAQVGTQYFETMGIGLIAGRDFSAQDRRDSPSVVIVNQTLAEEYWPGESAVGKILGQPGSSETFEVIGVVHDSKYFELTEDSRRFCYFPIDQSYRAALTIVAHSNMDVAPVTAALRERVAGIDPNVALFGVSSMDSYLGRTMLLPRLGAGLLTAFAVLGLILAAVGVYGLISYAVTRRRRELGIRLALGSSSREVIRLVLRDSLKLTFIGAALGLIAAIGAGRLAQGLLFETSPTDPLTLAATALVLIGTAALAAFIPALRAARVQPSEALRSE